MRPYFLALLDPELARQMSAADGNAAVEAVVRLRPAPGNTPPPPEETERLTHELVTRVQKEIGEHEDAVNVFRYLGSFAISAKPSFLRALLDQPEVVAALANRQPAGRGVIPPVEKRPARIDEVGRESGKRTTQAKKPARATARARVRRVR